MVAVIVVQETVLRLTMMVGMPMVVWLAAIKRLMVVARVGLAVVVGTREDGRSIDGEGVVVGLKLAVGTGEGQNRDGQLPHSFTSLFKGILVI
ncbi:unnamed protein product [Cuscuta campestris]|uniref:Uncharacterized protein n=1 Tax=Cuscuta campestris TaxID=132261 RepID=A0A484MAK2_9ASTE|nr:unnamed protein product [Cuscuta campestris]